MVRNVFLSATWSNLAVINFEIEPRVLLDHVPRGTELDEFGGKTFVSMVGFLFEKLQFKGFLSVPFHQCFEEVNLRFYVRRIADGEVRRGVVFIKEAVPSWLVAWVARGLYNENYYVYPMRHEIHWKDEEKKILDGSVRYEWKSKGKWNYLFVQTQEELKDIESHSLEEFILEHHWGYVKQRDGGTKEYQVTHPPWRYWKGKECHFTGDILGLYGSGFVEYLTSRPHSCFVAEGSGVKVYQGERIKT